jgi:hypothetical protein
MVKVFLGGTCNESSWRNKLIEMIQCQYFNPVVEDWTPACQENELIERVISDYVLYVITPRMTGVYSIAEVVDDSNKRPSKTLFCLLNEDVCNVGDRLVFTTAQYKSLQAVSSMVKTNGGTVFYNLNDVAKFLNSKV